MSQKKDNKSKRKALEKRREKQINTGTRALLALLVLLLIWTIWPLPVDSQTLRVNQDYLAQTAGYDCGLVSQLSDYIFTLQIPRRIWKSEEAHILLDLQRERGQLTANNEEPDCNITIETRLEAENLYLGTGNRIISTFVGADAQAFLFTISPVNAQTASGQLWVTADVYDASGQSLSHIPLFTVPFEIEVVSILGLPPTIVRYVVLMILIILLAIRLRRRLLRQR